MLILIFYFKINNMFNEGCGMRSVLRYTFTTVDSDVEPVRVVVILIKDKISSVSEGHPSRRR